jgi:hypothetical protein
MTKEMTNEEESNQQQEELNIARVLALEYWQTFSR